MNKNVRYGLGLALSTLLSTSVIAQEAPAAAYSTDLGNELLKRNGEAAIKSLLVDPDSAKFEWPYGFLDGYWKPPFRKRVTGFVTCGYVNARNRMGGFAGSAPFVVVLNRTGDVLYKELGTNNELDLLAMSCEKAAKTFPPAPTPASATSTEGSSYGSSSAIADQLEKLVGLRNSGALTPEEFELAKKKLLGSGSNGGD